MNITTQLRLNDEDHGLRVMMTDFNRACNWLSAVAFSEGDESTSALL